MKFIVGVLVSLFLFPVHAGDDFWREGVSEERFRITVYRSATCGCCKGWVEHLKQHNFDVEDLTVANVDAHKLRLNVPRNAASCHTAVVDGVVIEGHVPAQDIKRLLSTRDDVRLLTVPAMPSGTPGMDMPGAPKQEFKVYAIGRDDRVEVFNSYSGY